MKIFVLPCFTNIYEFSFPLKIYNLEIEKLYYECSFYKKGDNSRSQLILNTTKKKKKKSSGDYSLPSKVAKGKRIIALRIRKNIVARYGGAQLGSQHSEAEAGRLL